MKTELTKASKDYPCRKAISKNCTHLIRKGEFYYVEYASLRHHRVRQECVECFKL